MLKEIRMIFIEKTSAKVLLGIVFSTHQTNVHPTKVIIQMLKYILIRASIDAIDNLMAIIHPLLNVRW
jgi:hypothetical protein